MTEGLPAFVNCTREFLLNDFLTLMPKELAVGEILETVMLDAEVLAACRRMKKQGYRLALDDYCDSPESRQLLEIADFVKIDVLLTSFAEQERLAKHCRERKLPMPAEKVERTNSSSAARKSDTTIFKGIFSAGHRFWGEGAFRRTSGCTWSCCKWRTTNNSACRRLECFLSGMFR